MTPDPRPQFKVFKDFDGKFKWGLYTPRGEMIAEAPFGFIQKVKAVQATKHVKEMMKNTVDVVVD